MTGSEVKMCEAEIVPGGYWTPAEYCDNEAEEESDYCSDHAYADADSWEDAMGIDTVRDLEEYYL